MEDLVLRQESRALRKNWGSGGANMQNDPLFMTLWRRHPGCRWSGIMCIDTHAGKRAAHMSNASAAASSFGSLRFSGRGLVRLSASPFMLSSSIFAALSGRWAIVSMQGLVDLLPVARWISNSEIMQRAFSRAFALRFACISLSRRVAESKLRMGKIQKVNHTTLYHRC